MMKSANNDVSGRRAAVRKSGCLEGVDLKLDLEMGEALEDLSTEVEENPG